MTEIMSLIERLEKATGPNASLGREVLLACGWRKTCVGHFHGPMYRWSSPDGKIGFDDDRFHDHDPTNSLDAAMSLVPEGYAIRDWMVWPGQPSELNLLETHLYKGERWHKSSDRRWPAKGATPAIALCIASLKARVFDGRTE